MQGEESRRKVMLYTPSQDRTKLAAMFSSYSICLGKYEIRIVMDCYHLSLGKVLFHLTPL